MAEGDDSKYQGDGQGRGEEGPQRLGQAGQGRAGVSRGAQSLPGRPLLLAIALLPAGRELLISCGLQAGGEVSASEVPQEPLMAATSTAGVVRVLTKLSYHAMLLKL